MRVFNVPASTPFLRTVITALVDGELIGGFSPRAQPERLSEATLYLPTRRAARMAREIFLDVLNVDAVILPRIVTLGDIDEDELAFAQLQLDVAPGRHDAAAHFELLADILDTLVKAGANDIGNVDFSASQASKLLDDAREKALADARRKAEIYAKAAGVTLGAPLSIAEGGRPAPIFRPRMMAASPMATSTPVAQGEETLSVTVAASWAIKPAQ